MSGTTWHYENFEPTGSAIGFRITRKLDEVQSPFQKIEIYETHRLGQPHADRRRDDADHARQFPLSRDDVAPGAVHPCRARSDVVIIGGGDCGTLREVLRHPGVERAVQCDIDEQVTRMAEK